MRTVSSVLSLAGFVRFCWKNRYNIILHLWEVPATATATEKENNSCMSPATATGTSFNSWHLQKKRKKEGTENKKREKVRTAFVSWIPKGLLSHQNSNVVYSTKLQQKLLHSTTLVALGQFQIHSRGQELLRRRPMVNPGSFNPASVALYQPGLQPALQQFRRSLPGAGSMA